MDGIGELPAVAVFANGIRRQLLSAGPQPCGARVEGFRFGVSLVLVVVAGAFRLLLLAVGGMLGAIAALRQIPGARWPSAGVRRHTKVDIPNRTRHNLGHAHVPSDL